MKKIITAALSLLFVVCVSYTAVAGSIDSPGAPSAGSGMYTLQNLYDYLTSGTALTVQTSFQEPTSGPGSTMKTTKEIGDGVQALFTQCPVTAADVKSGMKFFSTVSGSWGVQTGTGLMQPTPTPTPTITPTPTPTITPTPWGPEACAAKGGYWSPNGLGADGCWFKAAAVNTSCDVVCAEGTRGLSCRINAFDDLDCLACKALQPNWVNCQIQDSSYIPQTWSDSYCYYRNNPNTIGANCAAKASDIKRLCVCQP
ncbi:MAG: hypothetical protein NTZ78_09280 [Candidatus Aureabacteria bacterium]|nr:hypothetical protein [Candidatus Auribacterota bacterium]